MPHPEIATLAENPAQRHACVQQAAQVLQRGGLVVIPTDTVYGIAVHPDTPDGEALLYQAKQRPADKPIPLLAATRAAVEAFGVIFSPPARRLADHYWPGPLTLVLPTTQPDGRTADVGFRVPDHPFTRALLDAVGGLLRVTSANCSGQPAATHAADALRQLGDSVTLVIDAGPAPGGSASSVVRANATALTILREEAIDAESIDRVAHRAGQEA